MTISKAGVIMIEKILEMLEAKKKEYLEAFRTHGDNEMYGIACGFGDSIEIVQEVAEEYNNGWIPCSVVDHPEHCKECEVTMIDTHGYTREIAFYTDRWRRAYDEASIIVVAWKEPSEPYKPNGE